MGRIFLLSTTFLVACAGSTRYRSELVGTGNGMVASRVGSSAPTDAVAAPGAGGIQLAQGNYELAMRFDVPRAQLVDYKIVCPGAVVDGQAGETFEMYRERRLAELRRMVERDRARVATATSIAVGAVAPRVRTETRVGNTRVTTETHVNADAVGASVANNAIEDVVELAPGDVGRGTFTARARVMTGGDGVCMLHVTADDADVSASFTVHRIRDLHAEQRMKTIAAREVAVKARGDLSARLVVQGADPALVERRRAEEAARASAQAQADFEARARAQAELRAKADLRARHEANAIYSRQLYLAYLEGKCNAEPGRRDRLEQEERALRERRLMADAELAQRRDQLALTTRGRISAQLIGFGAKPRPPRPAPLDENPGNAPFAGAEWHAGYWSWSGTSWEWTAGGWTDPTVFDEAGSDPGVLNTGAALGVSVGVGAYDESTRARPPRPRIVDHRNDRDHRDGSTTTWEPKGRDRDANVRDHRGSSRDSSRPSWEPKDHDRGARVRDHRKDDDKDDDKRKKEDDDHKSPRVRDHRF